MRVQRQYLWFTHMLKVNGLSLIELMVALALSSVGMLATSSLLTATTSQYFNLEQTIRLHSELNLIATVLHEDIQNAGFDGKAIFRDNQSLSPSSPFKNTLTISSFGKEPANSCITFAHDINANGELNLSSPNERRGYRLRDGAIEVRISGKGCQDKGWQDLTSTSQLTIDELEFEEHIQTMQNGVSRTVSESITAKLSNNKSVQRSVSTHIRLGNYFE